MREPVAPSLVSNDGLDLASLTPARVALGRRGVSLPTSALLAFGLDHARARDAVHAPFDAETLAARIGNDTLTVRSRSGTRGDYLRRPDLGRSLDGPSRALLENSAGETYDIAVVLGDGLSPGAVVAQAPPLLCTLRARLPDLTFAPPVIASHARVALGDEIGMLLGARLVVMLIGERPGLSTPESLGAYLTFSPRSGLTNADRNCVSNIHGAGLSCEAAAARIAWLARAALDGGRSGVALKDESGLLALPIVTP